jgi:hypothetical protein
MNPVMTLVFLFLTHTIATAIASSDQLRFKGFGRLSTRSSRSRSRCLWALRRSVCVGGAGGSAMLGERHAGRHEEKARQESFVV